MRAVRWWALFGLCLLLMGISGCDEHKKVPISPEIKSKRDKLMEGGGIPDPRTARQKLKDE